MHNGPKKAIASQLIFVMLLFSAIPVCHAEHHEKSGAAARELANSAKAHSRSPAAQNPPGDFRQATTEKKRCSAPVKPILDTSASAAHRVLTGGVRHSETLPPLQSKLNIGTTFDETKLEKPPTVRHWYKVPAWLAGTWESKSQTPISIVDYKTGKSMTGLPELNYGIARYGKQRDRKGGIWDVLYVPQEVSSETSTVLNKDLTTKQVILKNTDSQVVLKDVFTRRLIDKKSKKITSITQMEQISSIEPADGERIRLLGSLKTFDRAGKPLTLMNAYIVYKRCAQFRQCNYDKGIREDLRPSFKWFLKTHGLANLIPIGQ